MLCGLAVGVWSLGCAENKYDIQVGSAYGPGVKFDGIGTTYALEPMDEQAAEDGRLVSPEVEAYLRETVERGLAEKGFVRTDTNNADFWLDYYVAELEGTDRNETVYGVTYEEGSLVMDVIDPDTHEIIWQGAAYARIHPSDPPNVREQRMDIAVRRLLEKFPTKTGQPAPAQGKTGD